MSSLWLFCLIPTGVQGVPWALFWLALPLVWLDIHLPTWLFSHPVQAHTLSHRICEGKKVINLNEGLAIFLAGVGIFNHSSLWEELF